MGNRVGDNPFGFDWGKGLANVSCGWGDRAPIETLIYVGQGIMMRREGGGVKKQSLDSYGGGEGEKEKRKHRPV